MSFPTTKCQLVRKNRLGCVPPGVLPSQAGKSLHPQERRQRISFDLSQLCGHVWRHKCWSSFHVVWWSTIKYDWYFQLTNGQLWCNRWDWWSIRHKTYLDISNKLCWWIRLGFEREEDEDEDEDEDGDENSDGDCDVTVIMMMMMRMRLD